MPNLYIASVVPPGARSKIIAAYERVHGKGQIWVSPVKESQADLDNLASREIPEAGIKVDLPLVVVEDRGVSFLMATKLGVHFMRTPPYVTSVDPYPSTSQDAIQLDQLLAENGIGLAYAGGFLDEIRLLENFETPDTQKPLGNGLREIPLVPLSYEERASRVRAYLDGLRPYLLSA